MKSLQSRCSDSETILERFLEALSCLDRCFISDGTLDQLPTPSVVGRTRVGGIDINRPRMQRVIRGLLALSASPGGFTASQLAKHVAGQTALAEYRYGPRQASYDLKKLRGKEMVVRIGKTRRYEASPEALRALSAVALLQNKVIRPVLASVTGGVTTNELDTSTVLEDRYQTLRKEMVRHFGTGVLRMNRQRICRLTRELHNYDPECRDEERSLRAKLSFRLSLAISSFCVRLSKGRPFQALQQSNKIAKVHCDVGGILDRGPGSANSPKLDKALSRRVWLERGFHASSRVEKSALRS